MTYEIQCAADACDKRARSRGYCNLHYQRVLRYGDPTVFIGRIGRPIKGEHPTWIAIHARLRRKRGVARSYPCVDCGVQAREWSYNNRDENEIVGDNRGHRAAYSLDISNYDPRCVPCHRRFDFADRSLKQTEAKR